MKVRLYSSWRGHRYGDIVSLPADDHLMAWLGLGLCELVDEDGWDELDREVNDGVLRDGEDDEPGPADAVG